MCDVQLVVLMGTGAGQSLRFEDQLLLGRGTGLTALLDEGISRRHAEIRRAPDGSILLRDLGSRNGTYVNGQRVDEAVLHLGDRIAIGGQTILQLLPRDGFEDRRVRAQRLQAMGQLAGGVAHEFNNLLGAVLANVSYLQSRPTLDEALVRRVLAETDVAVRRASGLTRDLMVFARPGSQRHESIGVRDVIEAACAAVAPAMAAANVRLETDVADGLLIRGDLSRVPQALSNILTNSVEAMVGGGTLRLGAWARDGVPGELADDALPVPTGPMAVIRVEDSGAGMSESVRRRLFEPFFPGRGRKEGGGLGLATAHAIVTEHGGHIAVRSGLGLGTTVHLFVPLESCVEGPSVAESTGHDLVLDAPTVLLVDDEPLVRSAAGRVLTQAGFQVELAADGDEALALYRHHQGRIDLVILDLDMPNMGGEQAFAELRALDPRARTLISSGFLDRAREDKLRAAGIDGVLDKPYDSLTLLRAVATVLRVAPRRRAG